MGGHFIVGVNGQDGSYLAEHLAQRGELVHGVGRSPKKSEHLVNININYHSVDITNQEVFLGVLASCNPSIIYFAAAVHGASGFNYASSWKESVAVNITAAQLCLEYVRLNSNIKFIYFGSSKVFDLSCGNIISESSPRQSNCLYSSQKNYIYEIIKNYRRDFDLNCINLWLFNHESPRRALDFFIPKLIDIAARAYLDRTYSSSIYTLDFLCDWGSAEEYMEIVANIGLEVDRRDLIIATGITTSGREIAEKIFSGLGLRYVDHISVTKVSESFVGESGKRWLADTSSMKLLFPRNNLSSVEDICLQILKKNYQIKI